MGQQYNTENTDQPLSDQPNTPNAPQTPRVEEAFHFFNELLNAPTPSSTMMSVGGEETELGTSTRIPEQESESESEDETESESEMDEESEEEYSPPKVRFLALNTPPSVSWG